MSEIAVGAVGFMAMLAIIAFRAPIGLAMLIVGAAGYAQLHPLGWGALFNYMKSNAYHQFANYTLSVIPMFILMGALAERSGIATALLKSAERAFGGLRGGLAMAVIGACTAFGAICGSSVATTATFGRAALPELTRANYHGGFATGTIAVGGTLGILVPPSVILVVYAISTEQNIRKLFLAALVPGLLAALLYCLTIALLVRRRPHIAPRLAAAETPRGPQPLWPKILGALALAGIGLAIARAALDWSTGAIYAVLAALFMVVDVAVMPAIMVAVVVVGGIYGGLFSPTQGAAVGTLAMLLVGLARRTLKGRDILEALRQTAETSGMIFMILLGAEVFGAFLALAKLPAGAAAWISHLGLSPYLVLLGMLASYILLGAVMDELAMILLTLPVFFPIIQELDFGMPADDVPIWFGILVLIVVGIGLTAPPIGLNVFVVSALAKGVPIADTYRGVLPFIIADIVRLVLVVAMPGLALWLMRLLN